MTTKRERSVIPRLNGGNFYTQWPFSWPDYMTSLNFIKNEPGCFSKSLLAMKFHEPMCSGLENQSSV